MSPQAMAMVGVGVGVGILAAMGVGRIIVEDVSTGDEAKQFGGAAVLSAAAAALGFMQRNPVLLGVGLGAAYLNASNARGFYLAHKQLNEPITSRRLP